MANYERILIENSAYMHADIVVIDRTFNNDLVFASLIANDILLKSIGKLLKKKSKGYLEGRTSITIKDCNFKKEKQGKSDFSHMIIYKKDFIDNSIENENYVFYILYTDDADLIDKLYDKLYANTSIPIMKEWLEFLIARFAANEKIKYLSVFQNRESETKYKSVKVLLTKEYLLETIQAGLRNEYININNTNNKSVAMNEINGLDSYLNTFGETLANKIQVSFKPKFVPGEDEYEEYSHNYDDSCYYGGIEIYNAQKAVMQSVSNNLKKNKVTIIIGECGTGKTLMGAGSTYINYAKKVGLTAIIMCPSHLVLKWQRDIELLVPNAKAYIIENIDDLLAVENKIKNRSKKENTYLVISKETAKLGYEKRPAALWSKLKTTRGRVPCFVCPECGQRLFKEVWVGSGKDKYKSTIYLTEKDFLEENPDNFQCKNTIIRIDKKTGKKKVVDCGAKLWTALNRYDKDNKWIKLGSQGWVMKEHVISIYEELYPKNSTLNKKQRELLNAIVDAKLKLDKTGDVSSSTKGVRKYSVAKYIHNYFSSYIDYLILDEVHELKGRNLQSDAMGDLASIADKVICLTGTLLNGYAKGIFYILYRTMPELMKKEGFEFKDESKFQREFGVIKRAITHEVRRNGTRGEKKRNGALKDMPGVSPLIFTKFLLENSAFISLSDMAEGLPDYEEIPIGVDMDEELKQYYNMFEADMRSSMNNGYRSGMKVMGTMVQSLQTYPDMPYDQPPLIHPDTLEVLATPVELNRDLRNKEMSLLNLVREKMANNEKVLVYYEWTNRTDTSEKLLKMFKENNIRALHLTSSVKSKDREAWIEKRVDDCDVLLCNPKLVETGLDLIPFTSIVFYQLGYKLFTMRQASRRSMRLNQTHDVKVYFLYYKETIQEETLSLMASKMKAAKALEGKFDEEAFTAMASDENILAKVASNVVNGIKNSVDADVFKNNKIAACDSVINSKKENRIRKPLSQLLVYQRKTLSYLSMKQYLDDKKKNKKTASLDLLNSLYKNEVAISKIV